MPEQSKTVDQALCLLTSLGESGGGTASQLARRQGLSRTVAVRLLATLQAHGLVRREGPRYLLGARLLDLGAQVEPAIRAAARPALEGLAVRFGETALFALLSGDEAVAVEQVVPERATVQVRYRPGLRHPLAVTAHGRAILAFAPEAVRRALLSAEADGSLAGDLARIRREGVARSTGELEPGTSGLAAPVLTPAGTVIGSIGVVAPTHRFPAPALLGPAVRAAAAAVSRGIDDGDSPSTPAALADAAGAP